MATGPSIGFIGSVPIMTQSSMTHAVMTKDSKVWAWGLFCPGVGGMARQPRRPTAPTASSS
jgi:peptidylprolyl isomerase